MVSEDAVRGVVPPGAPVARRVEPPRSNVSTKEPDAQVTRAVSRSQEGPEVLAWANRERVVEMASFRSRRTQESSEALAGANRPVPAAARERRDALLREVCDEASRADWDGYGSAAVSSATRARAQRFLGSLPADLPDPEIAAHPTGAIGFEWNAGQGTSFSVSVSAAHEDVAYAVVSPDERAFGALVFGLALPESILSRLRSMYCKPTNASPIAARG